MGTIQRRKSAGIVETQNTGIVGPLTALRAVDELATLVEDGTLYELVLHDDGAWVDVDYESGGYLAERGRALLNSLSNGAIAFVAPSDVCYGTCRQMQLRMSPQHIEVEVFRDRAEAQAWLDEMRRTPSVRPPPPQAGAR